MKVKEFIVVEGKSDTIAIKRAVEADTIETNGSAVPAHVIEMIRHADRIRGVIIFTDPDIPGEKIRKTVADAIPRAKHAFLRKDEADGGAGRSLGIEHAAPAVIRRALSEVYTESGAAETAIPREMLLAHGLIGGAGSRKKREKLCEHLNIGYTNGKQLYKRLKMFQIAESRFLEALEQINQEDNI